jgi:hypothetical protein
MKAKRVGDGNCFEIWLETPLDFQRVLQY